MKKKKIIGIVVVVGIIGAAGYFFMTKGKKEPVVKVDFTEIKKSELVDKINTKGIVKSENASNVYSKLTYAIDTVPVAVGDKVTAGQVLMTLDTVDAQLNLKEKKAQLSEASKANLNQLQNNERIYNEAVNNLNKGTDSQVLAAKSKVTTAQNSLEIAQKNYDDKLKEYEEKEDIRVSNAKSAVDTSKIDLDNKKEDLEKNKLLYEAGAVSKTDIENMEKAIVNAEIKYNDALTSLANVETSMKKELDQLSDTLKTANLNYEESLKSESSTVISVRENINKYQSSVKGSQIAASNDADAVTIQKLEKQLSDAVIKSPINGTVTAVYAKVGATGNGLMMVVEDTEKLKITTKFKEYDSAKVQLGMDVTIKSDATGEESYTGKISKIAPTSVKNNLGENASTTDVEFEAEVTVSSPKTMLKIGMNTRLDVVLNKKENVIFVPIDAIVTNDKDEQILYIIEETAEKAYVAKELVVTTGMENDFYVEITNDALKEGNKIINDATGIKNGSIVTIE